MEKVQVLQEKLKIARISAGYSQVQVARMMGIAQTNISGIEAGEHIRLHPNYLKIFADAGIDINALFNDNVTAEDFEKICNSKRMLMLPLPQQGETAIDYSNCPECKSKERLIASLERTIDLMEKNISLLERRSDSDLLGEQRKTGCISKNFKPFTRLRIVR